MSDVLSIQQKEGKLRSKPSYLGKIVFSLPYGTQVKKLSSRGAWVQVSSGLSSGWIHKAGLTKRRIVLNAGAADVKRAASNDELVLAGKGFSEDVEKSYRQRNPALNFALIDKMEQLKIEPQDLSQFLLQGGLNHE